MSDSNSKDISLPPGWTRHVAPSGHYYYYHSESKTSTYKVPSGTAENGTETDGTEPQFKSGLSETIPTGPKSTTQVFSADSSDPNKQKRKRNKKKDVKNIDPPQFKVPVEGCDSWNMVILKSGRWFVYNEESNESFWDIPSDVMEKIEQADRDELVLLIAKARGLELDSEKDSINSTSEKSENQLDKVGNGAKEVKVGQEEERERKHEEEQTEEQEEEEEEEEEDDEDEEEEEDEDSDDEDLGQGFQFDWDEDAGDEQQQFNDAEELTYSEKLNIFHEMLDECKVNPYGTWDVELNKVIEDGRYDTFDSGSARLEAFDKWAALKIKQKKIQNESHENERNPSEEAESTEAALKNRADESPIGKLLNFFRRKYKQKYFYIDFKRKYRNDPLFDVTELTDKDKEKIYREYSSYKKKSLDEQVQTVQEFLASKIKPKMTLSQLPDSIFDDVRFYILSDEEKSKIVERALADQHEDVRSATERSIENRRKQYQTEKYKQTYQVSRERRKLDEENEKLYDAKYNLDRDSYKRVFSK